EPVSLDHDGGAVAGEGGFSSGLVDRADGDQIREMQRSGNIFDEASVGVAVSCSGDEQSIRSAFDGGFNVGFPDGIEFRGTFLALSGIGAATSFGQPSFKLAGVVAPAHVDDADIAGAEIVG